MLRGLKKALTRRAAGVGGKDIVDASRHTERSAAPSDGTVHLFALDEVAEGAAIAGAGNHFTETSIHGRREHVTDDSVRQRQAAAAQRRMGRLDPRTSAYQVSLLLSLSTFFEHKLQADTMRALAALRAEDSIPEAAEDDDDAPPAAVGSPSSDPDNSGVLFGARSAASASVRCADVARVALALSRWGHTVIVRRVLHSKTYWTKSFDNTFIVALDTSSGMGVEYIVDPHFRELFRTGAMSRNYSAVWDSLPPVFVGMPCQLQPVVQTLCEEVELSFLEAGRPCPPWRSWAATINRWMSDQFIDVPVPGPGASDAEVALFIERCSIAGAGACGAGTPSSASGPASAAQAGCGEASSGAPRSLPRGGAQQGGPSDVSCATASSGGPCRRVVQQPLRAQVGFDAPAEPAAHAPCVACAPPQQLQQHYHHQQQQQCYERQYIFQQQPSEAHAGPDGAYDAQGRSPSCGCCSVDDDFAVIYASGSAGDHSGLLGDAGSCGERPHSDLAASEASTFLDEEDERGEEGDGLAAARPTGPPGGASMRAGQPAARRSLLTVRLQQAAEPGPAAWAWQMQQQVPQRRHAAPLVPLWLQQQHARTAVAPQRA